MIIPLAKCTSFPAFLQRWLSSLLIPCCSFNVKNLFVLILLSFLATFSIVSLWHLFPPWLPWRHAILGFLLLLWLLFYWFFFICCSHFPLSSIYDFMTLSFKNFVWLFWNLFLFLTLVVFEEKLRERFVTWYWGRRFFFRGELNLLMQMLLTWSMKL